jgi:hypothetical protein
VANRESGSIQDKRREESVLGAPFLQAQAKQRDKSALICTPIV